MSSMKDTIEACLAEGNMDEAKYLIEQYEREVPDDIDLLSMKISYYLLIDDIETATDYALQGVRRMPLYGDMYYNLAYIYELSGQWLDAYLNYQKADFLYSYRKDVKGQELGLEDKSSEALKNYVEMTNQISNVAELDAQKERLNALMNMTEKGWGFNDISFRNYSQIVGKYFYNNLFEQKFVGVFKDQFLSVVPEKENHNMDVIHLKGEFLQVQEGQEIWLGVLDNAEDTTEYLLPIACSEKNTLHIFQVKEKEYRVAQYHPNQFAYYRIPNGSHISSTKKSYYGNPIPLKRNPEKKRLVLSIFLDGMAQQVIQGADFEKIMPYTYRYFKKGTICNRAYSASEWTQPSIATYVTGLDTTHHMLFHNKLDCPMPLDMPTIAEYFKKDGYYTANVAGDWRITPTNGHDRGYDRFVYQHQKAGFKVQEVIAEAINHLEAFQDVNQYFWISGGDLHDVADGDNLPLDVQKDLPLELRTYEDKGQTSAKQSYSDNKKAAYIRLATHCDRWLQYLYMYLEEHYKEDEIVVSLFADHGQGYLVETGKHFLSKERSNVAFMFRGGEAEGKGVVEEIMSTCDYSCILRKLAGVNQPEVLSDGRLPKTFGGSEEREYALSESIHPKDPYQAAVFANDETFFFVNPYPVTDEGRFELADYTYWLEDLQGNRIQNDDLCQKYLKMVLKHIAPLLIYK